MSALSDAIDELAARTSVTISEYVRMLGGVGRGGGTARAAAAIGVSQREVQRYLKAERGEGGQVRRPPQGRIRDVARDVVVNRLLREGVVVEHMEFHDDYDDRDRVVSRDVVIPPEEMAAILLESEGGTPQDNDFGQAFIRSYFGGTHEVSDVQGIRLELVEDQ